MQQFTYTVTDPIGLHARPAGMLVKAAGELDSEITLHLGEKSASARKLLALMMLGVRQGDTITVVIQGGDEAAGRMAMERFFQENL